MDNQIRDFNELNVGDFVYVFEPIVLSHYPREMVHMIYKREVAKITPKKTKIYLGEVYFRNEYSLRKNNIIVNYMGYDTEIYRELDENFVENYNSRSQKIISVSNAIYNFEFVPNNKKIKECTNDELDEFLKHRNHVIEFIKRIRE